MKKNKLVKKSKIKRKSPQPNSEFDFSIWFRSELVKKVNQVMKKDGFTHAMLAKKAGTSRPRITSILNKEGVGASTDFMIRILRALGYQYAFKFKKIAK